MSARGHGGHVVVLGGGFAGTLAAAAVAPHADAVTVIERDSYPAAPGHRRGLPQARHPHFLAPGGVMGLEQLLPGMVDRLLAAGAHRIGVNADLLFRFSVGGWMARHVTDRFGLAASRELLDHLVRARAQEQRAITFRPGCASLRLVGDPHAVRGVEVRDAASGSTEQLEADLVIDATGRGSRAGEWLTGLGIATPPVEIVDSGHAYATRVFRALPGTESGFPLVLVSAEAGPGSPAGNGILVPIEDGRWIVTVGGTRGAVLPAAEDDFLAYARDGLADPLIAQLIAGAEPLTGIMRSHSTSNRRVRFDRARSWPAGFVVVGDAATALNPVYGQGLSVAARCATALRKGAARRGVHPGTAPRLQRAIVRAATDPWNIATRQDLLFRNTVGRERNAIDRMQSRYGERVLIAAPARPRASAVLSDVMYLARPALAMGHPALLAGVLLGPRRPVLTEPPLTARESGLLAGNQVG